MGAVRVNLEEPEQSMIVNAKDNPTSIWRIRARNSFDVSTFVVGYHPQVRSVWSDGRNVCRYPRLRNISIPCEDQMVAVRGPVLLDRNVKPEGSKLQHVAPV